MVFTRIEEYRLNGDLILIGQVLATFDGINRERMDNLAVLTGNLTLLGNSICKDGSGFNQNPKTTDGKEIPESYRGRFNGVHAAEHIAGLLCKADYGVSPRGCTIGDPHYPNIFLMCLVLEGAEQIPNGEVASKAQLALEIVNDVLRINNQRS